MSNDVNESKDPEALLGDREKYALASFRAGTEATLAPSLNAKLFALYLTGKTVEDIRRMNPQYTLGQIVDARVRGRWDELKDEHLHRLLNETMGKMQQVTFEAADMLLDLVAATNNDENDHIRKYLQSKNPADLGRIKIEDLRDYKRVIETLQRLLGQDKPSASVNVTVPVTTVAAPAQKPATAAEAGDFLRHLAGGKKE